MVGAGSMGTVHAAYDPQLDRRVALKLLRSGSAGGDDRLLREARAMARLSHPNVVPVFDAGADGGQLFVAMELIDGPTLRAWLKTEGRGWRQILDAFLGAGEGLAAAHASGIVHRDFKPDNVLVDGAGVARVTDFGLARLSGAPAESSDASEREHAGAAWLTRTGALVGTPAYMSPEQLAGKPADARSDCFGFAVALYEALYGERPFHGADLDQLRQAMEADRVPAPRGDRRVPAAVRKVVLRALRHDPSQRPAGMRALLDELRAARQVNRRRALAGAAVALAGLALFAARARLDRGAAPARESTVELIASPPLACLEPGASAQLAWRYFDKRTLPPSMRDAQPAGNPSWSSADESVARVDRAGRVTAVAPGRTEIVSNLGELRSKPVTVSVAPAPRGRMAYDGVDPATRKRMVRLADLDGKNPRVVAEGANPRLSPEQDAVVYQRGGRDSFSGPGDSLYLFDLRAGVERVLKQNDDYIVGSAFMNDGKRVIFDYECFIETVGRDGRGEKPFFPRHDCFDDFPDVSPADGTVAFHNTKADDFIQLISADGDPATRRAVPGTANDYVPRWSPDGKRLAVWHGDITFHGRIDIIGTDGGGRVSVLPFAVDEHNYVKYTPGAFSPDGRWLVAAVVRGDVARVEALATDGSGCTREIPAPGATDVQFVGSVR